ncbi:hypothetical protein GOP47_0000334 [Adiantum capillus-veneris]|uniref:Uncharacterized protein n=1 Tax=Adiantum capillus-veneris TaxID=13818 RepID=A0A9D4VCU4_ADICA|nr:hypothetical protein GOP47_0000334 [Adiantum capillus-veneris]
MCGHMDGYDHRDVGLSRKRLRRPEFYCSLNSQAVSQSRPMKVISKYKLTFGYHNRQQPEGLAWRGLQDLEVLQAFKGFVNTYDRCFLLIGAKEVDKGKPE